MTEKIERSSHDEYETPAEAVRALLAHEKFNFVWEPCAGPGAILKILDEKNIPHASTTLMKDGPMHPLTTGGLDFRNTLHTQMANARTLGPNEVITNPPFKLLDVFMLRALEVWQPQKLAVFVNINALAGQTRFKDIYAKYPPSRIYIFSDRLTAYPTGTDMSKKRSQGTQTNAWLVWDKTTPYKEWSDIDKKENAPKNDWLPTHLINRSE